MYIRRDYNHTLLIGSTGANEKQGQTFIQSAIYHTYTIQFSKQIKPTYITSHVVPYRGLKALKHMHDIIYV